MNTETVRPVLAGISAVVVLAVGFTGAALVTLHAAGEIGTALLAGVR